MKKFIFTLCCLSLIYTKAQKVFSSLEIIDVQNLQTKVVFADTVHFEAPNWMPDDKHLLVNRTGKLYKVEIPTGNWTEIKIHPKMNANNDHGISPDGKWLVFSSNGIEPENQSDEHTSFIYLTTIDGGAPKLITPQSLSYWHGWSPDGKTLAYVARRNGQFDIYTIPVSGGKEIQLTDTPGLDDGPDYSPDGRYIYFNAYRNGTMQLWRMDADGANQIQLTNDTHSNWFPHPSPDGKWLVFLTFIEDQGEAHPFGRDVKLRLMNIESGEISDLTPVFFGGQGTINVPSWSPDSRRLAFVRYRWIAE